MKLVLPLVAIACTIFRTAWAQVGQAPFTSAPSSQLILTDDLRAKIGDILKTHGVVGYSLGIFRLDADEQEEYAQWGERTEAGAPVTKETIQGIASMSKAFAATAMGIVMDDFANGQNTTALPQDIPELTWDTKITDLIPEDWKLMDHWASDKVSIRDALSHVSGLPRHDFAYSRGESSLDVIRRMRYLRPSWEPREKYEYNNQLYMVAQHLIERYSGLSLAEFVHERIFAPLNMTSSTYSPTWANATGHISESRSPSGRRIPTWHTDHDVRLAGPGGVLSSAPDLLKWAKLWLDVTNSSEIGIPRWVLDECLSAQVLSDRATRSTYGFGWSQSNYAGIELIAHAGGIPGVSTYLILVPSHKVAVVALASSDDKLMVNSKILSLVLRSMNFMHSSSIDDTGLCSVLISSQLTHSSGQTPVDTGGLDEFPGPVDHYAGTHHDAAYGDIIICPQPHHPLGEECAKLYSDFDSIGTTPIPALFGYFRGQPVWAKYIIFTPTGGEGNFIFNATTIFPHGYGLDTTPFEVIGDSAIRGAWQYGNDQSVEGFGLYDDPSAESERHRKGMTVEAKAQSWFVRA